MLSELIEDHPEIKDRLISPFLVDVNPDHVSLLGLLAAIASGFSFVQGYYIIGSFLIAINGFLDLLDGDLARQNGVSLRGDLIDHTIDRLSDQAIIIGIAFSNIVDFRLGLITSVTVLLVSYLGTQAQALTNERLYAGILGRSDRMSIIFLGGLLTYFLAEALQYGLILVFILSCITFLQRFIGIYNRLGDS